MELHHTDVTNKRRANTATLPNLLLQKLTFIIRDLSLEKVKQEYDYVILDTSPVGLVADAFLLDKYADMSLFVLRHKYSYKTTIEYIERLFKEKRFNNLGIIVNGIVDSQGIGYSYGYGYGYSYGYGNNYSSGYYEKGTVNKATGFINKALSIFRR